MSRLESIRTLLVLLLSIAAVALLACSEEGPPYEPVSGSKIYYVYEEAPDGGDGSSWDDAFNYIPDAIAAAKSGDKIWIAGSAYRNQGDDDTVPYLRLKPGLEIYGGFTTSMTDFSERDPSIHVVRINARHAYHVVVGAEGAVLDGLILEFGSAEGSGDDELGAGLLAVGVSMTVVDCEFRRNEAGTGGGAYVKNGTVTFRNCEFNENYSVGGGHAKPGGGGLYVDNATVTLTDCVFDRNVTSTKGGGLFVYNSTFTATGCTFFSNSGYTGHGGGVYNDFENNQSTIPVFDDCEFSSNQSSYGGGMYNHYASPVIDECTFTENNATQSGGAIATNYSSLVVTNSRFFANIGDRGPGGVYMFYPLTDEPRFENCLFYQNSAHGGSLGGAMFNDRVSSLVTNCTFAENIASTGGAIHNLQADPVVTNCILWGNTDTGGFPEISNGSGSVPIVTYTNIGQAGFDHATNMNVDPRFINASGRICSLSHEDAGQASSSPCFDKGSDTAANLGLDTRSTRTDDAPDTDQVDLGYHHRLDATR